MRIPTGSNEDGQLKSGVIRKDTAEALLRVYSKNNVSKAKGQKKAIRGGK